MPANNGGLSQATGLQLLVKVAGTLEPSAAAQGGPLQEAELEAEKAALWDGTRASKGMQSWCQMPCSLMLHLKKNGNVGRKWKAT